MIWRRLPRSGTHPALLQRYLLFWVANLVERMGLVMDLIIAVLPPLYAFRVRSQIFRWYGQLRQIEQRAVETEDTGSLLDELKQLESLAEKISVPHSCTGGFYALRSNIALVGKKLQHL